MTILKIISVPDVLKGSIQLPASKSISNRVLIIRFLAGNDFDIKNLSFAADTQLLNNILSYPKSSIYTDNAGTVMRFLIAALSVSEGEWFLTGSERMKVRPVAPLVDALRSLGANITYFDRKGFPPVSIIGKKLSGGTIDIQANVSSQFISALLMVAPLMEKGLTINLTTKPVSMDYIEMTTELMKYFGVDVVTDPNSYTVNPQKYAVRDYTIESDWSSAAYIYALAALKPGSEIVMPGLSAHSIQGDAIINYLMNKFGIESFEESEGIRIKSNGGFPSDFEFDFTNYPDLVPVMTCLCAALKQPFIFRGVAHLRFKESDRLAALQGELSKTGANISIAENEIRSVAYNPKPSENIFFDPHNDHRLAMSLFLFSILDHSIHLSGFECVDKSYPRFWKDIEHLGIELNAMNAI